MSPSTPRRHRRSFGPSAPPREATVPEILPFGDAAFLVVLGNRLDLTLNRRALALAAAAGLLRARDPGWAQAVPAYASVLFHFSPDVLAHELARAHLEEFVTEELARPLLDDPDGEATRIEIPVRYGGRFGPDIKDVAELTGLTPDRIVVLHAETEYRVYMLGFAPGFAYLGTLPSELVTPRLSEPRPRIPPGSVGIGGAQTAVYPSATPGGLRLIGRTQIRLWDIRQDPPALLRPGMRVRFVPQM